jgi:Fic family protein
MNLPVPFIAKQLIAEYAHQSVEIENNHLKPQESQSMYEFLVASFFKSVEISQVSLSELSNLDLPNITPLDPNADRNQVIELRNHLIASHWIAEIASKNQGTKGLDENDVCHLSALTMKDLGVADGYYPWSLGSRVRLGNYRSAPIQVRNNRLRIFPYHVEVPACMRRFFEWRDKVHQEKKLHPLIVACHTAVYFVHIHPFPDGNGRVSRMIMHDYLVRQGYLPVVFQELDRKDYLRMIDNAHDGRPDEFVLRVLLTQLEAMTTFKMREI